MPVALTMKSLPSRRVLMVNLGGPRNADEIEKFLIDLLTDPLVVDIPVPEIIRHPLMRRVARKRVAKVAQNYAAMGFGGGSPLVQETSRQAQALQAELRLRQPDVDWHVDISMACGLPDIRNLSPARLSFNKENILLPLFPQFSRSTTLSLYRIIEKITRVCPAGTSGVVPPFHDNPAYLKATSQLILDFLQDKSDAEQFINLPTLPPIADWQKIDLLFSAHGIPMRLIKKGDRYVDAIKQNVHSLTGLLRAAGFKGQVHLAYQSRLGRARWIEPSTMDKLKELGAAGTRRIAIYPISFVSDHLETLEEIGVELRDIAHAAGIKNYHRIPAPGVYPPFIRALAELVLLQTKSNAIAAPKEDTVSVCQCQLLGGERPGPACRK